MSLVITRKVESAFYLGRRLDPADLEGSFDARVTVKALMPSPRSSAEIEVVTQQSCPGKGGGISRHIETILLDSREPIHKVDLTDLFTDCDVFVRLLCVEREERTPNRNLEARFAITAPGDVSILRDNARRRAPQEHA